MKKFVSLMSILLTSYCACAQSKSIDISADSTILYYQNGKISLPEWVVFCSKIREVDLSNHSDLHFAIEQLAVITGVEKLIIHNSGINQLPYNIYKIKNLRSLDLRGNHLQTLPVSIRYCTKLEVLDLDDNIFNTYGLVSIFKSVPKLEWLSINNNQLINLPAEICLANRLIILSISDNRISELSECIYTMKSLRQFVVKGKRRDSPQPKGLLSVTEVKNKFSQNGLRLLIE